MQFPKAPEADVASGVIHVTINGQRKTLPTLKIGPFEDEFLPGQWEKLQASFEQDHENLADLFKLGTSTLLDIIVAYDTSGALGGREWLRANADHSELVQIGEAIYERHASPFMEAVRRIMGGVQGVMRQTTGLAVMGRVQSTNGASPTGDSTPDDSDAA